MRTKELLPVVGIGLCYVLAFAIQLTLPRYSAIGLAGFLGLDRMEEMRWSILKAVLAIGIAWGIFRNVPPQTLKTKFPECEVVLGLLSIAGFLILLYDFWTGSNMGFSGV